MSPSRSLSHSPIFLLVACFCIFFLVGISHHTETPSTFYIHDRRNDFFLLHREDNLTSTSANTEAITTKAPLPSNTPSSSSISTFLQSSGLSSVGPVLSSSSSGHSSSSLSFSSSAKPIAPSISLSSSSAQSSITPTPTVLNLAPATTPTSTLSSLQSIATTLALTDYSNPAVVTSIITTSSSTDAGPTSISSALTSSTFWQKKGAVAATFTILAFVIVAISAILVVTFLKKRNAKQQRRLHEELFEKYSEDDHRSNSPGPSINAVPLDAFARRDVRHDNAVPFGAYPSTPTQRTAPSTSPVQHPDYYNPPPPARYILPSHSQAPARKPVPTSFREPMGRQHPRDSYQPSIDSFYGAAGQPSAT